MTTTRDEPLAEQDILRVSTIEMFFDLVFVFTITQVTHLVESAHKPLDFVLALLVLTLIWWVYDAYFWLTNAVGDQKSMRLVLIAAMAGFLVMALALPGIFGTDGLIFGLAYLYVVVIHLATFLIRGGPGAFRGVLAIAPFNLGAAALVIVAGIINTQWEWILFVAAPALFVLLTMFRIYRGFEVNAAYFVERHGLIIILALGESVIDIGVGAAGRTLNVETILTIVLALLFCATLWWRYFDGDDERAEDAMRAAPPDERARMALVGYWYTHLVMIFGIVLVASAIKQMLAHGEDTTGGAAWLLGAGLAVYLVGDVLFRWLIGIGPVTIRVVGAFAALALGVVGLWWGGIAELVAGTLLMVAIFAIEQNSLEIKEKS